MADYDLAIIGGGINGAGIARDAAGRGLRVLLVEQNDLASGTSSASSKLIHGGLRYLEHGAFRLVREALEEREMLLRMAPHVIRPLRLVLPPQTGMRSGWWLRLGLFIYDHLGGRHILPGTRTLNLAHHPSGEPLQRRYQVGFEYSDCWVDDSRLVVLNAVDAAERGATIRTRAKCVRAERSDVWTLVLNVRGRPDMATARVLINAAGPWVGMVGQEVLGAEGRQPVRLVKGSHLVVPKLFSHDLGYLLQTPDGRVVFALPFETDFTLIGTTDEDFRGDPATVAPSPEEIAYLCRIVNDYFRAQIGAADVVHAFAGVRSLHDDGKAKPEDVTRDYHLALDDAAGQAPVLTVYGGKITTYRRLAEAAMTRLAHLFQGREKMHEPWTTGAPLPGGDFAHDGAEALAARAMRTWPFLQEAHARRLVRAYGTRIDRVLGAARTAEQAGPWLGADLTGAEVRYLMAKEWAQTEDDVLWRRSKLGLRLAAPEREALARFMADAVGAAS